MIGDLILILGGTVIWLISGFNSGIGNLLPANFESAISAFFGTIAPFQFVFPVDTLLTDFVVVLVAMVVFLAFKYGMYALSFLPFVGHRELPTLNSGNTIDLRKNQNSGHTIDLRNGFRKTSGKKTMRDIY